MEIRKLTPEEESVLVTMCQFFNDNGGIEEDTQEHFDSLIEKVCYGT